MTLMAAHAVVRFGLGARPGEIAEAAKAGAAEWAAVQLDGPAEPVGENLASARDNLRTFAERYGGEGRRSAQTPEAKKEFGRKSRQIVIGEALARAEHAAATLRPFHERLALFWSNHFTVAIKNPQTALVAGAFEREAIRQNIRGPFATLLRAATLHQAMLIYLDNVQSVGPGSRPGERRGRGLNENLAREVLELHTVTPAAGYTQDDVTEFARALTGWTIGARRTDPDRIGETVFFDAVHEPGSRRVMGRIYPEAGAAQALAILDDLARHPATARHVAMKLARHFCADDPPAALTQRLERAFLDSGGDLDTVHRALIEAPETWASPLAKLKSPQDLLTSASRQLGLAAVFAGKPRDVFQSLAQPPFYAPSPEGWPDAAGAWLGPDAVMKRIEWARLVADRLTGRDARAFLDDALGPLAGGATREAVARAATGSQAFAIALMAPEFQRR